MDRVSPLLAVNDLTLPVLLDVALDPILLACGGRVDPHIARVWWWGPVQEAAALSSLGDLVEDQRDAPLDVVRRSASEVAAAHARGRARLRSCVSSHGRLDDEVRTVLVVHALTGDSRVGGAAGWWRELVGSGCPLDPSAMRVLCVNLLGSCYGSSGPEDEGFPSRRSTRSAPGDARWPLGEDLRDALPAVVTTYDQARAIAMVLTQLGVRQVDLVTGGSVGGMVAMWLARIAQEEGISVSVVAPIASATRADAWMLGWNHIGRALLYDAWGKGEVERRLALQRARQVAHMTYRAPQGLDQRQGRAQRPPGPRGWHPDRPYAVGTYLEHQGRKLCARFSPASYVLLLEAMDHHDLCRIPGDSGVSHSLEEAVGQMRGVVAAMGIDSDQLFPPAQMEELAALQCSLGQPATYTSLASPHGHDAFLIEFDAVAHYLRQALRLSGAA